MFAPALARAGLGFTAAVLSVLVFHQGVWSILHMAGVMPPPYPIAPVPPLGIPLIVDLCFWGGVYGVVYGLALPILPRPMWLSGLGLGLLAVLVGWFVVAPLKHHPIGNGFAFRGVLIGLAINLAWGLGVGLILPLLLPRGRRLAT